jgi:hypothetical protein
MISTWDQVDPIFPVRYVGTNLGYATAEVAAGVASNIAEFAGVLPG